MQILCKCKIFFLSKEFRHFGICTDAIKKKGARLSGSSDELPLVLLYQAAFLQKKRLIHRVTPPVIKSAELIGSGTTGGAESPSRTAHA